MFWFISPKDENNNSEIAMKCCHLHNDATQVHDLQIFDIRTVFIKFTIMFA